MTVDDPFLRVFCDESDNNFNFTSFGWNTEDDSRWAGGSRAVFGTEGTEESARGEFSFTFNGTSVSLVGSVPLAARAQSLTVQVDEREPFELSLRPTSRFQEGVYREIFDITQLGSDREHLVHVKGVPQGFAVDFASVNINGVLDDKEVIIDDFSTQTLYTGSWNAMVNSFDPEWLPYGSTSHRSSAAGDNMSFMFSGSSVSVVGFFNITSDLILRVQLDGAVEDIRYSPTNPAQGSYNFPWYSKKNLTKGFHRVDIETLEMNGQSFNVDYIRYSADNEADRIAAAEASKGRFPAPALGALGGILVVFLLCMAWICCLRQPRKRAEAARRGQESSFGIGPRDDEYSLDLDVELGPLKGEPVIGRAGPNAFALPPLGSQDNAPRNVQAQPFVISAEDWAAAQNQPRPPKEKEALRAEPLYHEVQQPSTSRNQRVASGEIGELYRVVQMLTAETEHLRGRLGEAPQNHDGVEPPPYEDQPPPPSRPSSRLLTPTPPSAAPPPGLPPLPPLRKERI